MDQHIQDRHSKMFLEATKQHKVDNKPWEDYIYSYVDARPMSISCITPTQKLKTTNNKNNKIIKFFIQFPLEYF